VRRSPVLEIFVWSRLALWATAVFTFLTLEGHTDPRALRLDDPALSHDLGTVTDVWARWDSTWFLRVAEHGYVKASPSGAGTAFFPLYPLAVRALGWLLFDHYVLAGILVSLAATLAAFFLFHRVAEERLGVDGARRSLLYLALFPTTFFLMAVYSEALYLALALAAFVLAERGRWRSAWLATGLAILTRLSGVALVPALLVLAWRRPDRGRALRSSPIALALAALYPLALWRQVGDPFAFARAEVRWHRHLSPAGPLGGIWDGVRAGWAGIEQLASGSHINRYWPAVTDTDPMRVALVNLVSLAFLVLFVVLAVVAWRRFGAPYGMFAAISLALPLSTPSSQWPLQSLPRLGLVVFPLFLALGALGGRPRLHTAFVAVSSLLLGVALTQWVLWEWVA
jgi:Mannosyltransferase (PIG-V)